MPSPSATLRLMRLHQPTGIWLLLWPCWWSIVLAASTQPGRNTIYILHILALFAFGAIVARAAGCIINDLWDRKFDQQVERTRNRPLASGEISVPQALLLLFILLVAALIVALALPISAFLLAVCALPLIVTYPLMKRITWWPQLFLGLTFNWGALMGWAAMTNQISGPAIALYVAGVFWTLGYDTIYAHQDKADDKRIGVKSSALRLGIHSRIVISCFYVITIVMLWLAGILAHTAWPYLAGIVLAALHFGWQVKTVNFDDSASCMKKFRSNTGVGWLLFLGISGSYVLN